MSGMDPASLDLVLTVVEGAMSDVDRLRRALAAVHGDLTARRDIEREQARAIRERGKARPVGEQRFPGIAVTRVRGEAEGGEPHAAELLRRAAAAVRAARPDHADQIEGDVLPAWEEAEEDGEEAPPC